MDTKEELIALREGIGYIKETVTEIKTTLNGLSKEVVSHNAIIPRVASLERDRRWAVIMVLTFVFGVIMTSSFSRSDRSEAVKKNIDRIEIVRPETKSQPVRIASQKDSPKSLAQD